MTKIALITDLHLGYKENTTQSKSMYEYLNWFFKDLKTRNIYAKLSEQVNDTVAKYIIRIGLQKFIITAQILDFLNPQLNLNIKFY